jgi:peroxiredoxin
LSFFHKSRRMLEAGASAPSFELKDLEGSRFSLPDLLAQGPVLLAFFKISCPVCQMTAPFLSRLAHSGSVQVFGISQDDAAATEEFNRRFGVEFPVLLDESRAGYPVSNSFGISSVPSIFLVEPDAILSTAFAGFSKADLEALGNRMGAPPFRAGENVPAFRAG